MSYDKLIAEKCHQDVITLPGFSHEVVSGEGKILFPLTVSVGLKGTHEGDNHTGGQ